MMTQSAWLEPYRERIRKNRKLFFEKENRPFVTRDSSRKFDSSGNPLPFDGWSVVHFLNHERQNVRNLNEKSSELYTLTVKSGIVSKLTFLPKETFHMTLVGIGTNQTRTMGSAIRSEVKECFARFEREKLPAPHIRIRGDLTPDGSTIIAPIEPVDKKSLDGLYYMRDIFRERLHPLGEDIVRNTPQNFHGHITLAYIINPLSRDDYLRLKEILKAFETAGTIGESELDDIGLFHFKTMTEWGKSLVSTKLGSW